MKPKMIAGRLIGRQDGAALVLALTTMFIVSMLGAAALSVAGGTINQTVWDRSSNQAFHIAEAGFDRAVAQIRNEEGGTGFTTQLLTGEAAVTITNLNQFIYRIRSVGAVPSLADPKARRAVEAIVLHINPAEIFFADTPQGTVLGRTTFEGPLYVRDMLLANGDASFDGGPFFVKDDPATDDPGDPTGDLDLGGSGSMGVDAPVYLFMDGRVVDTDPITVNDEIFTDVPDLQMPLVVESDERVDAELVIDSDGNTNGSDPIVITKNTASFEEGSYPGGPYLKWTKSEKKLEIDGKIFLDGAFEIGNNQLKEVTYEGRGTIFSTGDISIGGGFAPSPTTDFPEDDAFGLVTNGEMMIKANSGYNISAILYAYTKLTMRNQIEFYGTASTKLLNFDNNPQVHVESQLNKGNMPPGIPEMEAMTTISGWREVAP